MAYFFQNRLLRYALSQLDIFEQDDLQRLQTSWGRRSTVELRDIGIRRNKLASLLALPPCIQLRAVKIACLRLTVPADIYSSPIVVDISGVKVNANLVEERPDRSTRSRQREGQWQSRTSPTQQRTYRESSARTSSDHGNDDGSESEDTDDNDELALPTTHELAKSFLAEEPLEEQEQIQAAMNAQSSEHSQPASSPSNSYYDSASGVGVGLSLPGFIAGFLKGVMNRLEVKIKDVSINLVVELELPLSENSRRIKDISSATTTLNLEVEEIHVGGVGSGAPSPAMEKPRVGAAVPGAEINTEKRRVKFKHIRGAVLMERCVLNQISRVLNPESLNEPQSPVHNWPQNSNDANGPTAFIDSSSTKPSFAEDSTFNASKSATVHRASSLGASFVSSDSGKFDDADEAPIEQSPNLGGSSQFFATRRLPIRGGRGSPKLRDPTESITELENDLQHGSPFDDAESWTSSKSSLATSENLYHTLHWTYGESPPSHSNVLSSHRPEDSLIHDAGRSSQGLPLSFQVEQQNVVNAHDVSQLHVATKSNQLSSDIKIDLQPSFDSVQELSTESTPVADGNLTESLLFSHEEASSIYMSAVKENQSEDNPSPTYVSRMPGGWDDPSEEAIYSSRPSFQSTDLLEETPMDREIICQETRLPSNSLEQEQPRPSNTNEALKAQDSAPTNDRYGAENPAMLAKECFSIDSANIWIPVFSPESGQDQSNSNLATYGVADDNAKASSFPSQALGTYSTYANTAKREHLRFSEVNSSVLENSSESQRRESQQQTTQAYHSLIDVLIGRVHLSSDISTALIVGQIVQKTRSEFNRHETKSTETSHTSSQANSSRSYVVLRVEGIAISFLEALPTRSLSKRPELEIDSGIMSTTLSEDALFALKLDNLLLKLNNSSESQRLDILIGGVSLGFSDEDIISLKRETKMRMSLRDAKELQKYDVSIKYEQRENISDISISTIPMKINLDLQKIDKTLGSFGGVSGLLEVGSSILSDSTPSPNSSAMESRQRVVRFEQPAKTMLPKSSPPKCKFNLRIGGSIVELRGSEFKMAMHTSALKAVLRDTVIGIHLDEAQLSGPHLYSMEDVPQLQLHLKSIGCKYLFSPDESDLTRLISLLTPSKDKFEAEDDLLLDTLIRQRRKGAVLRMNIASAEVAIDDLDVIQKLEDLALEMSKLSSVAKYFPAETRPGLMTLAMVDSTKIRVNTDVRLGLVTTTAKSLEVAHVSAPSLLALGIDMFSATHKGDNNLFKELLPHSDSNRPLMLMARMIGDELEPTLKVKLWNACFEYSIPLISGFLDLNRERTTEELTVDLATSVLMVEDTRRKHRSQAQDLDDSGRSGADSKPLRLEFSLRDCAIGLNPRDLASRGLFFLSDCRFTGGLPPTTEMKMSLEIKKANLLIIDDVGNLNDPEDVNPPKRGVSFELHSQHLPTLCRQGYVSVMSLSAASIDAKITKSVDGDDNIIDVDVKDELFLMETCADSTQTLGMLLGNLSPPLPQTEGVKYRTEVAPVEDMMASFSGDAFATVSENVDSLAWDQGDSDEEFVASFDDIEVPRSSDNSLTDINEQSQLRLEEGSINLQALEEAQSVILGGGLQPKIMSSHSQGTAHKWDSTNNRYIPISKSQLARSPFRMRVHDVHFIWNLFDGYDWARTRETISKAVMDVETRAEERRAGKRSPTNEEGEEDSVIGDFLFNSIYIGVSPSQDPRDLTRNINRNIDDVISETGSGTSTLTSRPSSVQRTPRSHSRKLRLTRSRRHKIAFEISGVSVDLFMFPPGEETQSSVDVRIRDFEIYDHVPTSTWKKFATYMHDAGPREDKKSMVHLEICNVRPVPELTATELVIRVSVLPLRLHVDQDALDFMTRFFDFSDAAAKPSSNTAAEQPYLQRVEVRPVPIKLDYKPKKVDYGGLRSGRTKEFMNFFILDGADMVLRHAIIYGCSGFDRLHHSLEDVWMPDITRNQLPTVLAGLNGVRTLVNVGQGVRDLVVIPIQEYRRDGRVVRSISKGALAFARTTGSEITRFGAKLAVGAQNALQGAEGLLSPQSQRGGLQDWEHEGDDDVSAGLEDERRAISRYAHQPTNILAGLKGAARSLERDLLVTRDAIVAVAGEVRESGSAEGAARAVVRGAPTVVLRPMIGASRAAGMALMGAANSVDPDNLRRVGDKYKRY